MWYIELRPAPDPVLAHWCLARLMGKKQYKKKKRKRKKKKKEKNSNQETVKIKFTSRMKEMQQKCGIKQCNTSFKTTFNEHLLGTLY